MHQSKTIVVLGGSFNPVTNAHVFVANELVKKLSIDELWLVPVHSHAFNKNLEEAIHVNRMLQLSIESSDKKIKVNDIEGRLKLSGYTKDLWNALHSEYTDINFYIAIGQDVADDFDLFYEHEFLKKNARFIVFPRAGYNTKIKDQWYTHYPHVYVHIPIMKLSSTDVRSFIERKKFKELNKLMHPQVLSYIKENKLYETPGLTQRIKK